MLAHLMKLGCFDSYRARIVPQALTEHRFNTGETPLPPKSARQQVCRPSLRA
jgi:hypothetical protein